MTVIASLVFSAIVLGSLLAIGASIAGSWERIIQICGDAIGPGKPEFERRITVGEFRRPGSKVIAFPVRAALTPSQQEPVRLAA